MGSGPISVLSANPHHRVGEKRIRREEFLRTSAECDSSLSLLSRLSLYGNTFPYHKSEERITKREVQKIEEKIEKLKKRGKSGRNKHNSHFLVDLGRSFSGFSIRKCNSDN